MLRAASWAHDEPPLPPWPDFFLEPTAGVDQWRRWLGAVWARPETAEAIEVASPALADQVRAVCDGRLVAPRQVRRAAESLLRYVLRMRHRATPFGLFAGVAPVRFGPVPAGCWGTEHRAVARPDGAWLSEVITRLEACPELLRRLPVVLNNLCFVRGDRLVVPCRRSYVLAGHKEPGEVAVRRTAEVEAVRQAARSPLTVGDLADKVADRRPSAGCLAVIERVIGELVTHGVLITGLRPPTTVTDALHHVMTQLVAVGADDLAEVAPTVQELRAVRDRLIQYQRARPGADRRAATAELARRMTALCEVTDRPLAIDLRGDCVLVLPSVVAREAERAVAALARLTAQPHGPRSWRDYHQRFLERYGPGARVPLLQLVDADRGLGYPAGFRDALLGKPPPSLTQRDTRLLPLAQQAALNGAREVLLDDQAIEALAEPESAQAQPPPHTELTFHLHSGTRDDLVSGRFTLAVVSVSRAAGTMAGRFLHLFDARDRDRMAAAYRRLPTAEADALPVQVSCPPLYADTETIAHAPAVLPRVVSLAEHPVGGACPVPIAVEELAVSADARRLRLVSLCDGRPVEPRTVNAVEFVNRSHPLARFLSEIATAHTAALPFSWGAAAELPFLPRVRVGRSILAPARWHLSAAALPGPDASWLHWRNGLTAVRRRLRVPDTVFCGADDRRLYLDLTEPAHLHLLRGHLGRTGHATLQEAPEPTAYGWFDGRAHEIVLPLAATRPPLSTPRTAISADCASGHLPGASPWLYAKIYGHPHRQTSLLVTRLPDLLSTWPGDEPEWWFVRYQDPDPHLRLRVRLPSAHAYGGAAQRVGAWAAGLRRAGLTSRVQLDTYYPETGRYGADPAMAAAETVFAADSATAVAQLALGGTQAPSPQAVTAASLVDIAHAFTGGPQQGTDWLIGNIGASGPAVDRTLRRQVLALTDSQGALAVFRSLTGGARVLAAWERRRAALAAYRDRLAALGPPAPPSVLSSLLHLHHIRMAGSAPDAENQCLRLARAAALAHRARTERNPR
ncbi:lantibiotic dehydratase [Streptomyces sp. NPDC003077]|uniref:lantibiotic dehydratase n=1 Tax=Streptomyces sp. NPDC003077 TaxID=3154443 RepID=UPI0033AECE99